MCLCVFKCRAVLRCVRACMETEYICTLGLVNCQTAKTEERLNRRQEKRERIAKGTRGGREKKETKSLLGLFPASWKHTMKFAFSQEVTERAPWIDPLMEIWLFVSSFSPLRICLPRYWIIYSLPAFLIQPSIHIHSAHACPSTGPECSLEVYNGIDLVVCLLKWLSCGGKMIISPSNANLWVMINVQYNLAGTGAGNFHVVLLLLASWFVVCRHIKAVSGNAVV